jgi:large subunit ribosomal protein L31
VYGPYKKATVSFARTRGAPGWENIRGGVGYLGAKQYFCSPFRKIGRVQLVKLAPDMKKETHPEYQEVVFQDTSSDFKFITRSTMKPTDTITMEDGKTYPLVKIEVSSASHPFYTGKNMFIDTAGRVEKFRSRYAKKEQNSANKE